MELEITTDGKLRYSNNSNYKNDFMIRKEVNLGPAVIAEIKRIIEDSEITKEDDNLWPAPDKQGKKINLLHYALSLLCAYPLPGCQELEIKLGGEHISFTSTKIGSLLNVQDSKDPEGFRIFYYLVQDLKCFIFSLIALHFKIKPIP